LFTIGSSLASDPEKSNMKIPDLKEGDIEVLENWMDEITHVLLSFLQMSIILSKSKNEKYKT
jgi:hypothetical protein